MAVPKKQNVFSIEEYHLKIRKQKPDYTNRLLKIEEVAEKLNISVRSAYRTAEQADFPKRKRLSSKTVRWSESELDAWIQNK